MRKHLSTAQVLEQPSDREIVGAFLDATSQLSIAEAAEAADGISTNDVWRWRNDDWQRLSAKKRRALLAYLEANRGENDDFYAVGDASWLNLPDVSYLQPRARAYFNETILEYIRRKWTPETIEAAAALLLGYFTRASTLQSSGVLQPDLSEEMQLIVLEQSKEEIEYAFKGRGPAPKR